MTVQSDSKDEIGVLIRTFRRMMDEINKLISEVYEAKIVLQRTEMRALQAQINPHFLYNSLSIINWKAIEADEQEISKVTLALSTYYRTSLNRGGGDNDDSSKRDGEYPCIPENPADYAR